MDETRRLREPAAWLLLAVAVITALAGVIELLAGIGPDFQSRANAASDSFLGLVPVFLPFAAVLLATKFGPLLMRARLIIFGALGIQAFCALCGLASWIGGSFGSGTTIELLIAQFLGGALWLALLGLSGFYSLLVLRTPELRPAPKPQPQPGFGQQPGYPGAPGYPGMAQGAPMGQPGQPGQPGVPQPGYAASGPQPGFGAAPQPGYPSGQQPVQPGYPSGQQAPMPGYQQEYGQPESTSQMPAVGDAEETYNFGAQAGPQGYPQADAGASGPQFAPPAPGPAQPGQPGPGWPGGFGQPGQPSGPQPPQPPQPGQPGAGWPGGFGQPSGPQDAPQPYAAGGFGQPSPGGFGQPEASPYPEPSAFPEPQAPQDPPSYAAPSGPQTPEFGRPEAPQPPAGGEASGFDALFGQRPEGDEPDDVQRTYRIPHDPEAFRNGLQPPPDDQR